MFTDPWLWCGREARSYRPIWFGFGVVGEPEVDEAYITNGLVCFGMGSVQYDRLTELRVPIAAFSFWRLPGSYDLRNRHRSLPFLGPNKPCTDLCTS